MTRSFARRVGVILLAPVIAAVLGAVGSLSQAPASTVIVLALALPGVFLLHHAATGARAAAAIGGAFGFGYFFPGLLWVGEAFLVDAETFAWMRPFAVMLLPLALCLFWAAAFAGAAALRRWTGRGPAVSALVLAIAWALADYARGQMFTGFPWGLFAFAWLETPVAQTAAWIGPYGLNGLTLLVGLMGAAAVAAWRARSGDLWAPAGVGASALTVVAALWIGGAARLGEAPARAEPFVVRLVQPNVAQREKWRPDLVARNEARLVRGSRTGVGAPDMIVWPETAVIPERLWDPEKRAELYAAATEGLRRDGPPPLLILGSQRFERAAPGEAAGAGDGWKAYNSLFALSALGRIEAIYDKHHLVPFGEFLPFQDAMEALGLRQLAGGRGSFAHGPGPRTVAAPGAPPFLAWICYEAIFPDELPPLEARPEMILQITNDAWFGDSGGPHQHLAQARMRAIEQGLPFLRAANTGVSAAIDPYGRVTDALALGVEGALDVVPAAPLPPTPYARWGEGPAALLLALALFGALFASVRRARSTPAPIAPAPSNSSDIV